MALSSIHALSSTAQHRHGARAATGTVKSAVAPHRRSAPMASGAEAGGKQRPTRIIIDTDPGVDDMMALVLALRSPELQVEGLTIVFGNSDEMDVLAANACLALTICGKSVPVVKGSSKPLATEYHGHSGKLIHGPNAIGGVAHPVEVDLSPLSMYSGTAEEFIADKCRESPGEITVVTLGPLANLARALLLEPRLPELIRRHVMMGGSVGGRGNKTPTAEANLHNDPEAGEIVFDRLPDITMAGLDVTHKLRLLPEFRARMRAAGPLGCFVDSLNDHYVDILQSWGHTEQHIHDSAAILALLRPDWFVSRHLCVRVETEGKLTRGVTAADWSGHWRKTHRVQTHVLLDVDEAKCLDLLVERVGGAELLGTPVSS